MIRFECDKCGASLGPNDAERFIVRIEVFAAAGPIDLSAEDLTRDAASQMREIIESLEGADPNDVEDQTYRSLRFDLCVSCHRAYLQKPLG